MPDETIEDVVFDVGVTDTDQLREAWKKAKARYAPELTAHHIDFSKGLGPTMDKWAASYAAFNKSVRALNKQKALWTSIPVIARTKIKAEAKTLQTDAAAVTKVTAKYLAAIPELGDPAETDLTTILTKISQRAEEHRRRAEATARARAN